MFKGLQLVNILMFLGFMILLPIISRAEVVVVGGQDGLSWQSGGGAIPATIILSGSSVEKTNAPGGVIDFEPLGRPNWIVPQRADTTRNIAIGLDSALRGGTVNSPNNNAIRGILPNLIDDDGNTALDMRVETGKQSAQVLGLIIDFDLGARFGLNRFKFFPRNGDPLYPSVEFPFQNEFLRGFELFVNDGLPESQFEGTPILQTVFVETQNDNSVVDLKITPQYVRYVRLKVLTSAGFDIAEFQVFGTGYVPEASFISNIFDFGDMALFGNLRWVQDSIGDSTLSSVTVRTRSGNDPQPIEFTKVRPGERIFRVGGGAAADQRELFGGWAGAGTTTKNPEVPWKWAKDIDDATMKALVEDVLDNENTDVREALTVFGDLSLEQRDLIELSQSDYRSLKGEDKGEILDDVRNWSEWSPPYSVVGIVNESELSSDGSGQLISSPGPRRYFQFAINFASQDFYSAAGIGGLAFDVVSPPYARELIAEIAPRTAEIGINTRFVYAVLNRSDNGMQRGFDEFEVKTPLRVEQIGKIRILDKELTIAEADFTGVSLEVLPATTGLFSVIDIRDDGFRIGFPLIEKDGVRLEIEFHNGVLRYGTNFEGRAFNSSVAASLGQQAIAGNVTDLNLSDVVDENIQDVGAPVSTNLAVAVPITNVLLANVSVNPKIGSPNGDGINDVILVDFDITNIARPSSLVVDIFDLNGVLVRRLVDDQYVSGRFSEQWDGRDNDGQLVVPGHYPIVISLKAGTGKVTAVNIARIAY
ncbi:MAG: FlgD immunoglobulin-like domain containing protein [Candidatus Latescibacterota bacterium]|nr:FlgD immunoglobulin-like domain containing protein [Candidatus Latescibacterota bacterium]